MIRLEKSDRNTYVEVVVRDSDSTWMEITDEFVHFLQACGYIVEGIDIADHLTKQYGFQRKEKSHAKKRKS
jgi:predicted RND superfamily exporter protein